MSLPFTRVTRARLVAPLLALALVASPVFADTGAHASPHGQTASPSPSSGPNALRRTASRNYARQRARLRASRRVRSYTRAGAHTPQQPSQQFSADVTGDEHELYERRNAAIAADYDAPLKDVFADPDRFFGDLSARFEAQKAHSPDDPYQFDFSDYGVPVLSSMRDALANKATEVRAERNRAITRRGVRRRQPASREYDVGLEFLGQLEHEISQHVASGRVSYRRLLELAHFSASALGYFDQQKLDRRERALLKFDRAMQGYDKVTIDEEYRRYRINDARLFPAPEKNFVRSVVRDETHFLTMLEDRQQLRVVMLPTMQPLGEEPFLQLLQHNIVLSGVTSEPLPADGFLRPGKDFKLHDDNHNAMILARHDTYRSEHALGPRQAAKLSRMVGRWQDELDAEMASLPAEMRAAVRFLNFNLHHDRGFPQVPSTYAQLPHFEGVSRGFFSLLTISGQTPKFRYRLLRPAQDWLTTFWTRRLPQEHALWAEARAASATTH